MNKSDWKRIQERLHKLGFNPGTIDGIRGRNTIKAVKLFQAARGLEADGIVGPKTFAALFGAGNTGDSPRFDSMPWFDEALRLEGTREVAGPDSNPVILDWADNLALDYEDDDIPWCGLFTGHCVGSALPDETLPAAILRARAWESFGKAAEPQRGAVMVFWRSSLASGKGHVGFYFAEDGDTYHVLGGNQSNSVNVTRVSKDRFLAARWPLTAMEATGEIVVGDASGAISTNEA